MTANKPARSHEKHDRTNAVKLEAYAIEFDNGSWNGLLSG